MTERGSGILLHITSLPGMEGIGTFGSEAFRFIDFLEDTGQKIWQILPLGPVGFGNSPYQCYSAFAGDPLFIDLSFLIKDFLLSEKDVQQRPKFSAGHIDFRSVRKWKYPILRRAFENYQSKKTGKLKNEYSRFLNEHTWWLHDYALFMAAKIHFNHIKWNEWEKGLKFREKSALRKFEKLLSNEIAFHKFLQFLFFRQWFSLKAYAHSKGIRVVGDLPLYVSGESVDVWSNTDIFLLDENLDPVKVGGVPPDYFSETGQLWGNPLFDWPRLNERGFDWWLARLHFNLHLFDQVRIDHFRGLEAYWSVPASEKTAVNGEWVMADGFQLLRKFKEQVDYMSLIAEDLGVITPRVEQLRDDFRLPGMKVLQFAFGTDETDKNLPHNYTSRFVAYTGTHDNNTTLGWLRSLKGKERKLARNYLGRPGKKALKKGIEMIWSSCAQTAILPVQDLI
jgi:4-alpha-glucanotransferase